MVLLGPIAVVTLVLLVVSQMTMSAHRAPTTVMLTLRVLTLLEASHALATRATLETARAAWVKILLLLLLLLLQRL